MRHRDLINHQAFDLVSPPELDPSVAPTDAVRARPEYSVSDMPKAAAILLVACYAAIILAFAVTIRGARVELALAVGIFYLAMFFGVPAFILKVEADPARRPRFADFLANGIDTATGPISGAGALVQMLVVPALLALGVLAMGVIYMVS